MNHRISAGMILVNAENHVLMVRNRIEGKYDFWVAPGGGVQGAETLQEAAAREVLEETGLVAVAERLIYVEEMFNPETRHCKFWFTGYLVGGEIDVSAPEATNEFIVQAKWLSRKELNEQQVFPLFLPNQFWSDREAGIEYPQHTGLREMSFW